LNTVFAKTLLWFFGTVVLTITFLILAAALNFSTGERRRGPLGALMRLQFSEAVNAYEIGGVVALRRTMARFQEATETISVLTDRTGRDLVTGEDRSDLVAAVRQRSRWPFMRGESTFVGRRSRDGRYFYFLELRQSNIVTWFLQPEIHLTILVILALLCYAFARYLTNPVGQLQRTVDRFGKGELDARARINRSDEIGQLARSFNEMADRTQTLLAAERRLLLDISHELRSPLARLSVAVELARMGVDVDSHLNRIEKEADRLNSLVGELLQVTRVEGDKSQLRSEQVALHELLADVVEDARLEAAARGCDVALRTEPISIFGDPELLLRAIENVVRNGIRYAPAETSLQVSLTRRDDHAWIQVRDLGPGVPDESLSRIFDPFYRVETDRDRASGGAGLGLAIARRAVELHHGSVAARNADPGLLVEIELPIHQA
jgi:signal transduction histidine kinase